MKVERIYLIKLINTKILNCPDKNVLDTIGDEIIGVGKFTALEYSDILTKVLPVENLLDAELFWIIQASSKYINSIKTPSEYFDVAEIERYGFHYRNDEMKVDYPITFTDVVKLSDNQYAFPYSIKDIMKLKHNRLIEAQPELQRESKSDKYGTIKVYSNPNRVRALKTLYENKEYAFNSIRFNLMDDGQSEFYFDEEARTITVNKGRIIVPDGNHRTLATESIALNKSCVDDKFIILFTFFDIVAVKRTISQEWNVQPVQKSHKNFMNDKKSNKIVDAIKRSPDADVLYSKKIVTTKYEVNAGDGFILYDIFSDAINRCYVVDKLETQDELSEISEWLVIFFNRLTSILLNDFKGYRENIKTKWSISPYAFIGYVLLSKHLKGDENWREKLKTIINNIDFSIEKSPINMKTPKRIVVSVENFFNGVISNEN